MNNNEESKAFAPAISSRGALVKRSKPREDGKVGAVAVIGAGIAGMQASLDLADSGFKVYLIERSPSIGGNMAKLDKTFPTGDCAMCTISPRMVGVARHANIKLLVNSEIESLSGEEGNFTLTIRKKARYVDEALCTGCGACAEVCPAYLESEFSSSIASRKAIYIPFPQAAPLIYTIDKEHCINCSLCEIACEPNAIKKDDKDREMVLNVGAVVVAAGFEQFNPKDIPEYGFGVYKNVITNLQFERMLSSSGPTAGKIARPGDGKEAKKIAFIQCVGSRDVRRYAYCSRICCMASTKEALVAREHDSEIKPTIFYIDMRAFGKGYQEYVDKASKEIRYIRGRVSKIWENKDNGNLTLNYENTELGKKESEEFDLVVLASALKPCEGMKKLAGVLGTELSEHGFFKTGLTSPFETTRKGVFVAGGATGPMDIPDAISQAGAAASAAASFLWEARGTLTTQPPAVEEKKVAGEEPRVGVFICHCGRNIASVVDVKNVSEHAKSLDNVAFSKDVMYACSAMNLQELKSAIRENNLNRVVVASCSPRMHEVTFRTACSEAGLNPYLFEMANIREHCSWVHANDKKAATEKAKSLVGMAVSKAKLLTPEYKGKVKTKNAVLVIGGGASGCAAAISCAEKGFNVVLVERENKLGGWLNKAFSVEVRGKNSQVEPLSPQMILDSFVKKIENNKNISLRLNSVVANLSGFAGNFSARVRNLETSEEEEIEAGAIIAATGTEEKKPELPNYGKSKRIITLNELEGMLKQGKKRFGTIAFIQCFNARDKSYPACSRICCIEAIKNARVLRKLDSSNRALILYRDLMTFGMFEESYLESQKEGVRYIRYSQERQPKIEEKGESIGIKVYDTLLEAEMEMLADYVVLSTPQIPSKGYEELQKALRVPVNPLGFFMEAHMKLKPVEFISNGIFLAGNCHSPKELPLALAQACAAASKASALLSKGEIETEAITSFVDRELCIGCGRCYAICPFSAITLVQGESGEIKSEINQALCKGCGLCSSVCPNAAITLRGFTREQIIAQIEAALAGAIGDMT